MPAFSMCSVKATRSYCFVIKCPGAENRLTGLTLMVALGSVATVLSLPGGQVLPHPHPSPIPSNLRPSCVSPTSPGTASPVCGALSLFPCPAEGFPGQQGLATPTPHSQSQFGWVDSKWDTAQGLGPAGGISMVRAGDKGT